MEGCCATCVYAKHLSSISRLICRRYPPCQRVQGRSHDSYYFPTVNTDEWCGEYKPAVAGGSDEKPECKSAEKPAGYKG